MTQAIKRLKVVAASAVIEACNAKTAELLQSLHVNVSREFRLEKEHVLSIFGPRHVCAAGEWYVTGGRKPLDPELIVKTTKFLNRMFTLDKGLGKRTAEVGTWYFASNDPNLLVALMVKKMKQPKGTGPYSLLGPQEMVPYYMEVYYVDRTWLGA